MMKTNQQGQPDHNSAVVMDSRRFLGLINSSVQTKVTKTESIVRDLGRHVGANWRLAALRSESLVIEDVDANDYYVADHRREKGGRIVIDNVRPIKITETKKHTVFEQSCQHLLEALEQNDQKGMASSYNRLAAQRFTSRTVPTDGRVRTYDGVLRVIPVVADELLGEDLRRRLVAAVIEGIGDKVIVREGRLISASFGEDVQIPISEWVCRKVVARQMRTVAENAYWSSGFQDRIYAVARLVNEDKIVEAVRAVSPFLAEQQEFTLLNRGQLQRLVENTLATRAVFNQRLCTDVATLLWRTNLKVNKNSIVDEWRATAKKAGHATLLENVQVLETAKNFEQSYDTFLKMIFAEAIGPREVQVDAYKTALMALKGTPKIKGASELSGKIDELIERLGQPQADQAVIAEVEDLLAEVKNEMNALQNLDNFDQMPGGPPVGGAPATAPAPAAPPGGVPGSSMNLDGAAGTTVNFNININGKDGAGDAPDGDALDGADGEDDDELAKLLGQGEEQGAPPAGGAPAGGGQLGGGQTGGGGGASLSPKTLNQDVTHQEPVVTESDPYAFNTNDAAGFATAVPSVGSDYGTKPIQIHEDVVRAVRAMFQIAARNKLERQALGENVEKLAAAGMKTAGLIVPQRRRDDAVRQVCEVFADECGRRVSLGEDQYKWDWAYKGGRRRQRYGKPENPRKMSQVTSERAIRWLTSQDDGMLGEFAGTRFVFDHGGADQTLEPIVMSEDGQVEVPIPAELTDSAFAAAAMTEGDQKPFLDWLGSNILQLRPIAEAERDILDEAVVRISTGQDGGVTIEVDSEDGVEFADGEAGGEDVGGEAGMIGEPGGEDADELAGGDDLGAEAADDGMKPVGAMPDESGDAGDELPTSAVEMPNFDHEQPPTEASPDDSGSGETPDLDGAAGHGAAGHGAAGHGAAGHGDSDSPRDGGEPHVPPVSRSTGRKPAGPPKPTERGVAEDNDITDPQSSKYGRQALHSNPREQPKPSLPPKTDDKLDGFDKGKGTETGTGAAKLKKVTPRTKGKK